MNVQIFSIFDMAAKRYMDPFTGPTIEFALRGFKEACTTAEHQFNKFPEDYCLYHVGTFDADLGAITPLEARKIAMASSFVQLDLDIEGMA